jgi:Ran GTPase-activating protein (RanGAP) involved in mRNA processing and transport
MEWLLEGNGLDNVEAHGCSSVNGLRIARGLRSNQSLTHLSIESSEDEEEADEVTRSISEVEEVTRSISGETIEAVPAILSTNKQIQLIHIVGTEIQVNVILQIVDAMTTLDSFTTLTIAPSSIGMVKNAFSGLQVLKLPFNGLWDAGAVALASRLKTDTNLELLDCECNGIGSEGAITLTDSLFHNTVLKERHLSYNAVGDDGAVSLAQELTSNATVMMTLKVSGFGDCRLSAFFIMVTFHAWH